MSSTSPAPASCLGYPIAKYGMSLCTLGLAAEFADAAYAVLTTPARERTGQFRIDEDVLRETGITDFSSYAVDGRGRDLDVDLFLT